MEIGEKRVEGRERRGKERGGEERTEEKRDVYYLLSPTDNSVRLIPIHYDKKQKIKGIT